MLRSPRLPRSIPVKLWTTELRSSDGEAAALLFPAFAAAWAFESAALALPAWDHVNFDRRQFLGRPALPCFPVAVVVVFADVETAEAVLFVAAPFALPAWNNLSYFSLTR
jgi:hypothetical protein